MQAESILIFETSTVPRIRHQPRTTNFAKSLVMGCMILIITVAGLDTWFAVDNTHILQVEKNPICEALLRLDPNSCVYFITGKIIGTVSCLGFIATLFRVRYRHAGLVLGCVTTFQVCLLIFLIFSDPTMHGLPNFGVLFNEPANVSIWSLS